MGRRRDRTGSVRLGTVQRRYGGVGVGGLATAGGIGWLSRQHGLTIDHVVAVDLVLADGEVVRVDADHDRELFWVVRGAGSAVGIVTAFELIADPVGDVAFAQLAFDATDLGGFLGGFGKVVEAAPRSRTANLMMGGPRHGTPHVAHVMAMVDSGDSDEVLSVLQPLAGIAPLVGQHVQLQPYKDAMVASSGPQRGQGEPVSRSILVEHFTPEVSARIADLLRSGAAGVLSVRSAGGAVADVPADATAYAGRLATSPWSHSDHTTPPSTRPGTRRTPRRGCLLELRDAARRSTAQADLPVGDAGAAAGG